MNTIYFSYYKSPYGELKIGSFENKLCLCDWRFRKKRDNIDKRITNGLQAKFVESETEIIVETIIQLKEFFERKRQIFSIPLLLVGSDFQKKVWKDLLKIPYGSISTYLQLAIQLGNDKAIRAVAGANGANAISIIVPCHRIIGSNGELVGYAGGINTKKRLLEIERSDTSMKNQLSFDF